MWLTWHSMAISVGNGTCAVARTAVDWGATMVSPLVILDPRSTHDAAQDVEDEDDQHEDQRRCPCQLDLVVEGHAREVVDKDRQRGRRLAEAPKPIIAEQRRKQERRRLSGDAGGAQHDA